ncbi:unnamed protein product [Schistocephalus solidus]|uniref:THAP-type domain-containing protein n=1 Tax=Schistocephalus solidus TaxID=70667 RepID=A0A183SIW6_SCHSO|nr:unnamed protein product [Schistocephalus solidus]
MAKNFKISFGVLSITIRAHQMPTTCGFPNCKFRSRYRGFEDNRHFYRVPKKPAILRHKWLEAIERTEATIVSQLRICSGHFHGGEKREGDIPVADPAVDPPRRIELPPKGVRFSSKGISRAFKAHFHQSSSTSISGYSCARSNRGGSRNGTYNRPSGRYKTGLSADYAGDFKTCSRPNDMPNLTLHGFYPVTSRIFPSSSSPRTPSVDCIHPQGSGWQHRISTNKHATFSPDNGVIFPPSTFLPPLSNLCRPGFQKAFNEETTSQGYNTVPFLDSLDTKHLPLVTDLLKSGLQFLEMGTISAEVFAKHAMPNADLKSNMLPEFNSMTLLWNSLRNLQTPPLHSLPPTASLPAATAAPISLPFNASCVYANLALPYLTSGFERKEFSEFPWHGPTSLSQSSASARKDLTFSPKSALSLDNALDQGAPVPRPRSPAKFADLPTFCEKRREQPTTTGRSSNATYKGDNSEPLGSLLSASSNDVK